MAAADGFRLAVYTGQLSEPVAEALKVIVPARTMQEIQRLVSEQSAPVQVNPVPGKRVRSCSSSST